MCFKLLIYYVKRIQLDVWLRVCDDAVLSSPVSRLAQQYVYPQAFLQPSLVLGSQLSPTAGLSPPFLDYSSAYTHYTTPTTGDRKSTRLNSSHL